MNSRHPLVRSAGLGALACALVFSVALRPAPPAASPADAATNARRLVEQGQTVFRFDTFGDERFWSGTLHLDAAIVGASFGGVGAGVSPTTALAVGLKVDANALPQPLKDQLAAGRVDLENPAVTLALLALDAVVGVRGKFDERGGLKSLGITCALCHSTVDDSFSAGIGTRLDGWPNRDLDVGKIISLAPDLSYFANHLGTDQATVVQVLQSWGPGKFDAALILDGKTHKPDGTSSAVLIPAAFGLGGTNLATYGGWGGVSHWNAFVATLEMHGQGTFYDARLRDAVKFPLAAAAGFADVRAEFDLVTPQLAALQAYQLALPIPEPPPGSFDPAAAARGERLFGGQANCASCHVPPLFTEPGHNLHKGAEIGIDEFQALRSPTDAYRTTPLGGLHARSKGGYYHDGRFATLADVVTHYDAFFVLGLSAPQQLDLIEYLRSL